MGKIVLTRLDYRMVHGQIAVTIINRYNVNSVFVVDDEVAKNKIVCDILRFGMKPGVSLEVIPVDEAVEKFKNDCFGDGNHLVIFREAKVAYEAWNKGLKFEELNVGQSQLTPDRQKVYRSISLNKEEALMLKELDTNGVHVYFKPLPDDLEIGVDEVLKKFN